MPDVPSPRRQEIDSTQVHYSNEALAADLRRLSAIWDDVQSRRDRKAIYLYLGPVFNLVEVWEALGQLREIARRALRLRGANLRLARAHPGKLSFGSSGTASPHHLAGELLRQKAGIDIQHVPYKGIAWCSS
jgi:Tripartite tricarboxylate transporter family receptor